MRNSWTINRRHLMLSTAAGFALASGVARASAPQLAIKVYKDPSCGCCGAWVDHLKKAGFTTDVEERFDMNALKTKLGVPSDLASCHTGLIDGYAIEGHVPAADIKRLVASRATAKGLAVAGMPVNSPGMEVSGEPNEQYMVWLFQSDGKRIAYAQHGG